MYKAEGGYKAYREFVYKSIPILNEKLNMSSFMEEQALEKLNTCQTCHEMISCIKSWKIADHKGSHFEPWRERNKARKIWNRALWISCFNKEGYILAESESKRIEIFTFLILSMILLFQDIIW